MAIRARIQSGGQVRHNRSQVEIAQAIVDQKADYVLDVKRNQPTLHDGIQAFFDGQLETDFEEVKVSRQTTQERGHGREETRHYFVCAAPKKLPDAARWPKLKAIGVAISDTMRGGKNSCQVRYSSNCKRRGCQPCQLQFED